MCGTDRAEFDPEKVEIGPSFVEYDFLATLMELGVDVMDEMLTYHKPLFVKYHAPKICLQSGQGLRWLAATCYVQHNQCLPDPASIPCNVTEILHLAKYRPRAYIY